MLVCMSLVPSPVLAAGGGEVVSPGELLAAFTDICLNNLGNPAAQISAAEGPKWGLTEENTDAGQQRFRSRTFVAGLRNSDSSCAITAELPETATLMDTENAFRTAMGAGEPRSLEEADSVYWLIATQPGSQRHSISLKVSAKTGSNLGTFMISKL